MKLHGVFRVVCALSIVVILGCPRTPPKAPTEPDALRAALAKMPASYTPRTKHKNDDGSPRFVNRLILQKSPYLLQHAHNPVNWFPYGEEAFARAQQLKRPIFLSVGYATCHWCHVMEEESFEDLEIAQFLNDNYVAIKVDREERPDVDAVYMAAVRAITRGGGWPMSVWMTPEGAPFMGGTYFPARDGERGSRKGFLTHLKELKAEFDSAPNEVAARAAQLSARVKRSLEPSDVLGDVDSRAVLDNAFSRLSNDFDDMHGGRKRARKFPSSLPIRVLLRHHRRTGDPRALEMATLTLDKMMGGGLYDPVGGGFHRYTVDRAWTVPHFEKMLYDNALLVVDYLEAFQLTKDERYKQVAVETLDYLAREMRTDDGGFYSATDADSPVRPGSSHREEGLFFTWTPAELEKWLGPVDAARFANAYGVTARGNFEGRTVLQEGVKSAPARAAFASIKKQLYEARKKRPPPLTDTKTLASWNALAISAFAKGHRVTGDARYLDVAKRALRRIIDRQSASSAHLMRTPDLDLAFLDDYAFVTQALLDVHDVAPDPALLKRAVRLDAILQAEFAAPGGGFYRVPATSASASGPAHKGVFVREKPDTDNALPSGNSVHALNLLRLHALTGDDAYRARAAALFGSASGMLARYPTAASTLLLALDFALEETREVVLVGDGDAMTDVLRARFTPNVVVVDLTRAGTHSTLPLAHDKAAKDGAPTAFVCRRGVCELPSTEPAKFASQLEKTRYPNKEQ